MGSSEVTFPVFCPKCHEPVALVIDTDKPTKHPQHWECPYCSALNLSNFQAHITIVAARGPLSREQPPDLPDDNASA